MISVLKKKNNKKGFTLAELLIVVAIIAILVAVAIPVFNASLQSARDAVKDANLRAAKAQAAVQYLESLNSGTVETSGTLKQDENGTMVEYEWSYSDTTGQFTVTKK